LEIVFKGGRRKILPILAVANWGVSGVKRKIRRLPEVKSKNLKFRRLAVTLVWSGLIWVRIKGGLGGKTPGGGRKVAVDASKRELRTGAMHAY